MNEPASRGRRAERLLPAAAALALAVLFQGGLLFMGSLHHFDWFVHWHYYDWIRTALREHGTLPLFMADAWHTSNFVANAQSPVLGPLVWLLAWLPTELYVKGLVGLYTAIGALGGFWLARELGARATVAACAAVLWTCGGFFAAHVAVGHHWSLGGYWLPWLFLLVRRAAAGPRLAGPALLGAAAVQAATLLEGQHHPFLWQSGLVGLWAVLESARRREPRVLAAFLAATSLGVCLAGARVVPLVLEFADYLPEARIGGLPPGALAFSLLARGQGPDTPAGFGVVFDHGSGWWEYTFYLGAAGLVFVAVGVAGAVRREAALLGAGLVAALLSLDTNALGFDVWELLRRLPVASSQRCPSRLLVLAQFAAIFAAAAGWERWLAAPAARRLGERRVAAAFALLAALLAADLVSAARPWQAAALGPLQSPRPHRLADPVLAPEGSGTVRELERSPNRMRFRVESGRTAFLVFPLPWKSEHDAWRTDPLPTAPTSTGLLAVRVPAGETLVDLRYRTPGLCAGIALSACALVGVAAVALLGSRGSRPGTRAA